jgi:hypothetical protein
MAKTNRIIPAKSHNLIPADQLDDNLSVNETEDETTQSDTLSEDEGKKDELFDDDDDDDDDDDIGDKKQDKKQRAKADQALKSLLDMHNEGVRIKQNKAKGHIQRAMTDIQAQETRETQDTGEIDG